MAARAKTAAAKDPKKVVKMSAKTSEKKTISAEKAEEEVEELPKRYKGKPKGVPEEEQKIRRTEIEAEIKRLTACFTDIPADKRRLVKATITDVAFLTITMNSLREQIAMEGVEIEYRNGENQWGTKQSPAVATYNQMSQRLTASMKILLDCQPKAVEKKEQDDNLDDFILMRGDD